MRTDLDGIGINVAARLRDPAALSAGLGIHRANLPPQSLLSPPPERAATTTA